MCTPGRRPVLSHRNIRVVFASSREWLACYRSTYPGVQVGLNVFLRSNGVYTGVSSQPPTIASYDLRSAADWRQLRIAGNGAIQKILTSIHSNAIVKSSLSCLLP